MLLLQIASAQKKQHSTEKCVCKQYHYDTSFFPCQILTTGPLWRSKTCHYLFFMGAGLFPWIIHSSTKLQGATPALAKLFPHSARSTEVQDSYSVFPSKVYYCLKFYRSKVHLNKVYFLYNSFNVLYVRFLLDFLIMSCFIYQHS